MKPSLIIFWVEPRGPPVQRRNAHMWPLFAFFKCDVRYSAEDDAKTFHLPWIGSSSPRSVASRDGSTQRIRKDKLEMLYQKSSQVSECISYIDLFMWIWKISTFSPDLAVTWEFCPNDTFLFVHQSACFMNVLQRTVFVSLLEKKNCPRISESKQKA